MLLPHPSAYSSLKNGAVSPTKVQLAVSPLLEYLWGGKGVRFKRAMASRHRVPWGGGKGDVGGLHIRSWNSEFGIKRAKC